MPSLRPRRCAPVRSMPGLRHRDWRLRRNAQVCESYPPQLVVPAFVTDDEVIAAAKCAY